MMYVDLAELSTLFNNNSLWSVDSPAIASFKRSDHYGNTEVSLTQSIQELIFNKTGAEVTGPIRLLTHFRYFGYVFNPLSLYYCYNKEGSNVEHVVAEVTNMPWKETHWYVLTNQKRNTSYFRARHKKEFHVSPFMDLNMEYQWKIGVPEDNLSVHIENLRQNEKIFDASISMKRIEINQSNLAKVLLNFPLMTLKVSTAIHVEAFKLWFKGISYIPHPKN